MKNTILATLLLLSAPHLPLDGSPSTAHAQQGERRVVTLQILGMVTPNCPVLVKAAVARIDGVSRVTASLEHKSAEVEFRPGRTSIAAIQKAIKDQVGFDSRVVERE